MKSSSHKTKHKSFRAFLEGVFTEQELEELYLTLGESKTQVTRWINAPQTIPFVIASFLIYELCTPIREQSDETIIAYLLDVIGCYEIGFDAMTLRHYHAIKQHDNGHYYTLEELLRGWSCSIEEHKTHLQYLKKVLQCNSYQLIRWIKFPQIIPHKEAVIIVHSMERLSAYNSYMNKTAMSYDGKTMLEENSLYADFQIGFDTIPLRTVFKFIRANK